MHWHMASAHWSWPAIELQLCPPFWWISWSCRGRRWTHHHVARSSKFVGLSCSCHSTCPQAEHAEASLTPLTCEHDKFETPVTSSFAAILAACLPFSAATSCATPSWISTLASSLMLQDFFGSAALTISCFSLPISGQQLCLDVDEAFLQPGQR